MSAKTMLRNLGRRAGFDIRLNGLRSREELRLVHFLNMHEVDLVLDVGGNVGQFGKSLIEAGYRGQIISFEPLPEAHAMLSEVARRSGAGRWRVAERGALGDHNGEATFHVTLASASSSLAKPLDTLVAQTAATQVTSTITVPVRRLDDLAEPLVAGANHVFLKLDTQGSEDLVLRGAQETLSSVAGVLSELSLTALYDRQAKAEDVHALLVSAGFEIWDIWPGYRNPRTLRLNQVDGLYFRPREARPAANAGT